MALPPLRKADWYNIVQFDLIETSTKIPIEKELWLYIRSFSEIESRGQELVKRHQGSGGNAHDAWTRFRSFARQAESYWQSARSTSYRSSPLLYYYSFLNLAKAYLVLVRPTFPNRVDHGLTFDTDATSTAMKDHALSVRNGPKKVFPLLYRDWCATSPPDVLMVQDLLSYARDIGHQYQEGGFGPTRSVGFIDQLAFDRDERKAWIVVAFPKSAQVGRFGNAFAKFLEIYEQAELARGVTQWDLIFHFGFTSGQWRHYDFYQMKPERCFEGVAEDANVQDMGRDLSSVLKPWIAPLFTPTSVGSRRNKLAPERKGIGPEAVQRWASHLCSDVLLERTREISARLVRRASRTGSGLAN